MEIIFGTCNGILKAFVKCVGPLTGNIVSERIIHTQRRMEIIEFINLADLNCWGAVWFWSNSLIVDITYEHVNDDQLFVPKYFWLAHITHILKLCLLTFIIHVLSNIDNVQGMVYHRRILQDFRPFFILITDIF